MASWARQVRVSKRAYRHSRLQEISVNSPRYVHSSSDGALLSTSPVPVTLYWGAVSYV